jgi:hypothetical protein
MEQQLAMSDQRRLQPQWDATLSTCLREDSSKQLDLKSEYLASSLDASI